MAKNMVKKHKNLPFPSLSQAPSISKALVPAPSLIFSGKLSITLSLAQWSSGRNDFIAQKRFKYINIKNTYLLRNCIFQLFPSSPGLCPRAEKAKNKKPNGRILAFC